MTPRWIDRILSAHGFQLAARILLTITFWLPGIMQALQFQGTVADFVHFHVTPAPRYVVASIITLLLGSAIVVAGGKWTWLGAGALGIYTGLTIFIAHNFWTMQGADRLNEMRAAIEHVTMIGGLMVVAISEHRRGGGRRG